MSCAEFLFVLFDGAPGRPKLEKAKPWSDEHEKISSAAKPTEGTFTKDEAHQEDDRPKKQSADAKQRAAIQTLRRGEATRARKLRITSLGRIRLT